MSFNFSKSLPWSGINPVTLDGQSMVKVPKFYIKVGYPDETSQNAGKRTIWISARPRDGFHIHPAFVKDNKVMDCFYYGAYEASMEGYPNGDHWDSTGKQRVLTGPKACSLPNVHVWNYVFKEEAKTACEARNTGTSNTETSGWHLHNVYEVWAIALLMLTECGRTDMRNVIGDGNVGVTWTANGNPYGDDHTVLTGMSGASWRGIHELWGNVWEHMDGITTDESGRLSVFDHKMDGTYVGTGIGFPSGGVTSNGSNGKTYKQGWPVTFSDKEGVGYDLKDILCPVTYSAETYDNGNTLGSIHDFSWWVPQNILGTSANVNYRPQTNGYAHGGFGYPAAAVGPFVFDVYYGYANANSGFRLAKYGETSDEIAFSE